jgi:hypothetical protein
MRLRPFGTAILTLVAMLTSVALAAPVQTAPELDAVDKASPENSPVPAPALETLNVTQPPPFKKEMVASNSQDIFFPYQSSVSPRVGAGTKNQGATNGFYFLGLNYMLESATKKHFEVGVDLTSDTLGLLHLARKWVFNSTTAFRPYVKAGPTIKLVADQQLATFLKVENYQLRVAGGFERLLKAPMSLRIDLEAALTSGGYECALALGYSWAW